MKKMIKKNDLFELIAVEGDIGGGADAPSGDTTSSTETQTVANENTTTEEGGDVETPVDTPPTTYNIDGQEYTIEQLREFKNAGLRQSDYTKKTQEIANMRKQYQEAIELTNYLKSKPELLNKLVELDGGSEQAQKAKQELDPVMSQINDLKMQLKVSELDKQLSDLKANDPTIDDVELLKFANEKKLDLETAYYLQRGMNFDKILNEKINEVKASLTKEIQDNKKITKTLIGKADVKNDNGNYGLTEMETLMATKLGMSAEEYAKYKNPKYRG